MIPSDFRGLMDPACLDFEFEGWQQALGERKFFRVAGMRAALAAIGAKPIHLRDPKLLDRALQLLPKTWPDQIEVPLALWRAMKIEQLYNADKSALQRLDKCLMVVLLFLALAQSKGLDIEKLDLRKIFHIVPCIYYIDGFDIDFFYTHLANTPKLAAIRNQAALKSVDDIRMVAGGHVTSRRLAEIILEELKGIAGLAGIVRLQARPLLVLETEYAIHSGGYFDPGHKELRDTLARLGRAAG